MNHSKRSRVAFKDYTSGSNEAAYTGEMARPGILELSKNEV